VTENASPGGAKTADEIRTWLLAKVAARVGADPRVLDPRERFSRYGLDSMKAAGVTAELSEFLGRPLPRTLVWDHPSVDALVRFLTSAPSTSPAEAVSTDGAALVARAGEPIAIVGLACRFPSAPSPEAYWRLLVDGIDAVREVPAERWDLARYFDEDVTVPGRMSTRWGAFIDGVDQFDPQFFGISPREAEQMDPQQRIMMELAWEAFEDAGINVDGLKDSRTGVYVGAMWSDYARLLAGAPEGITQHTATGQDTSITAARVSYTFGLRGPSLAVNTACSSSLVAVHLACEAIRNGEASLALAGGVSLVLSPESTVAMSKFGAMAPDGRSKAFDARANGYVRGEGAGLVVLKPLSRAIADGDRVYCVILAEGINNDGFSNGLTAPNPQAQEDMLRIAYARAGLQPDDVDYIETHGTGTQLGDPIEANAIGRAIGAARTSGRPLRIGSVKTNIGHLEAAAGMAGLIKVALATHRGVLPRSLHFEAPNPNIDFDGMHLAVQSEVTPWPPADRPAIAGVSSFGFGGTNCHVVVQQRPRSACELLPLSAQGLEDLRHLAGAMGDFVRAAEPTVSLSDLCRSGSALLSAGPARAAVTARTRGELASGLDAVANGLQQPGVAMPQAQSAQLVWVLSAHGGQWAGMGRQLFEHEPVFREAFKQCAAAIADEAGWNLLDELFADESRSRLGEVAIAQPAIFSIQTALAALWRSWGIEPDAVIGHSMGEVAAVHVAGVLSLRDGVKVICQRSRLLARTEGKGALGMIGLSAEATRKLLAGRGEGLWVVAFNSPVSTLVSGEPDELAALLADVERDGVFCRRVRVDVAPHSPKVDPLLDELAEAVRDIKPRASNVRVCSTVDGRVLDASEFGAGYWVRNLRQSVLFAQGVDALLNEGATTFMELGPHPVLAPAVEQCLAGAQRPGRVIETLRRGEDERAALLDAAGKLYAEGRDLNWPALAPGARVQTLPEALASYGTAEPAGASPDAMPLTLCAHSRQALDERVRSMADHLRANPEQPLHDICYTLNLRRSLLPQRFAAVAADVPQMIDSLDAFAAGERRPGTSCGAREMSGPGRIAFVFPGQGSQWAGMSARLIAREPVFRQEIERCHAAILKYSGFSLLEELTASDDSRLSTIDVIQPALFAVQVALAALWRSWGIEPAAVVGHSMGEVAASCVAGAISLDEAARIICRRSRLLRRISGQGLMAVVELSRADAEAALKGYEQRLSVAVSNSPRSTVISGDPAAVNEVVERLTGEGVFCRHVKVDVASHSPQVDALRDDLLEALDGLEARESAVPLYSTVTGHELSGAAMSALYWTQNLRKPVLFSDAVSRLIADGFDTFIEVSAHPLLIPSVQESLLDASRAGIVVPSLRRDEEERSVMLGSLGALFTYGHDLDWRPLYPQGGRHVALPIFPWQRQRCWVEAERPSDTDRRGASAQPIDDCLYEIGWTAEALEPGPTAPKSYLVVADRGGAGIELADALRVHGDRATVVDGSTPGALGRVALREHDAVVHLTGLDAPEADGLTSDQAREAAEQIAMSGVSLVQTLVADGSGKAPRVYFVTRGAQAVAGAVGARPTAAALWGLASVVAVEHPELRCTRVDLDPADAQRCPAALIDELRANASTDLVGFRAGARYAARLVRDIAAVDAADVLGELADVFARRPDAVRALVGRHVQAPRGAVVSRPALPAFTGTYLISGGLGALGLETASWLVEHGARHLVLLGRRGPSDAARDAIVAMEQSGATVRTFAVDVSREEDIAQVLATIATSMPPLKGVVHAAGLLDDAVVTSLDATKFRTVLAPKVQGAWVLHRLTQDAPLDFFILYSSVLAYLGAAGQANHAAANAVLDAIAYYRRSRGLPATSINWGAWAGVGLAAARADRGDRLATMGLASISAAEGRVALERLMVADAVQGSVMHFDASAWAQNIGAAAQTLLAGLAVKDAATTDGRSAPELPLADRLQQVPAGRDRREFLETWLVQQVARILRLSPTSIDVNKPVRAMGLDSLMAVELRKKLEAGTAVPIPTTLVWNYPTVVQLAPEIAARMGVDLDGTAAAAAVVAAPGEDSADLDALLGEIEALSEEDARRALENGQQTQVTDV
jgi:acyl transferase domain-containing protein/acyl carrier protein